MILDEAFDPQLLYLKKYSDCISFFSLTKQELRHLAHDYCYFVGETFSATFFLFLLYQ
jgi:hypothetical protein